MPRSFWRWSNHTRSRFDFVLRVQDTCWCEFSRRQDEYKTTLDPLLTELVSISVRPNKAWRCVLIKSVSPCRYLRTYDTHYAYSLICRGKVVTVSKPHVMKTYDATHSLTVIIKILLSLYLFSSFFLSWSSLTSLPTSVNIKNVRIFASLHNLPGGTNFFQSFFLYFVLSIMRSALSRHSYVL
jgi:hypothetical protein